MSYCFGGVVIISLLDSQDLAFHVRQGGYFLNCVQLATSYIRQCSNCPFLLLCECVQICVTDYSFIQTETTRTNFQYECVLQLGQVGVWNNFCFYNCYSVRCWNPFIEAILMSFYLSLLVSGSVSNLVEMCSKIGVQAIFFPFSLVLMMRQVKRLCGGNDQRAPWCASYFFTGGWVM